MNKMRNNTSTLSEHIINTLSKHIIHTLSEHAINIIEKSLKQRQHLSIKKLQVSNFCNTHELYLLMFLPFSKHNTGLNLCMSTLIYIAKTPIVLL